MNLQEIIGGIILPKTPSITAFNSLLTQPIYSYTSTFVIYQSVCRIEDIKVGCMPKRCRTSFHLMYIMYSMFACNVTGVNMNVTLLMDLNITLLKNLQPQCNCKHTADVKDLNLGRNFILLNFDQVLYVCSILLKDYCNSYRIS